MGETLVHELPFTEMLHVECHPKEKKIVPSYHLHGHNLQNVRTAKYLGIIIQDNLNWGLYIDTVTRRNLNIGNKKTKETVYKAFVRPILEYSATVWDPHSANDIKTIETVHRRAARWVSNKHHQTSCDNSIVDSLAWPTVQQCRKQRRLEMFYKCHHRLVTIDSEYLPQPIENRSSHRKNNTQLQHSLLQDTIQTYLILPPDHTRMEQPAPGNTGSQVPGLFQVQACCPPGTMTDHPSPSLPFVSYVFYPPLLCHSPFHYISEVFTATTTNQHNHHNTDVG